MQHMTLKATTVAVDQELGEFEALVSGWDADREKDTITPTAFDRTIEAWQRSGKRIPVLFEHSPKAIGHVDPGSMRPTDEGLIVAGEIDRSTDEGRQVWQMIKSGTAGFSIGYMAESRPREGGGREILEVDLLEISATATPMHPATRALSWKSAERPDFVMPSDASVRERMAELERQQAREDELAQKAARRERPVQIRAFEC